MSLQQSESEHESAQNPVAPLRLNGWLRKMEEGPPTRTVPPASPLGPRTLPDPVFPRHPELLGDVADEPLVQKRRWTAPLVYRAMRGWMFPYIKSRVLPGDIHPIIAYLFTDWKCNVDCHYCPSWDNRVPGMTEDMARRSIDWLASTTCRVLAVMGGEPLVRPKLVHKVIDYAVSKGFWVYVGTNGRLLKPDLVDRLGDAGVAVYNLAVDVIDEKPGLPKALNALRPDFEYLLKKQYKYGYMVFFNICICRTNHEDVKQLTEAAHDCGLATDYHICESPMYDHPHFKHLDDNSTFITPDDWPKVDELVDWLVDKHRSGYKIVNSIKRLNDMKDFMRGKVEPWNCRAGQNSIIIRTDGTLGPCMTLYSSTYDWGHIEEPKFDVRQLDAMKVECQRSCFSTLNHNLGFCYNDARVIRWMARQAARGFQSVSGSFE